MTHCRFASAITMSQTQTTQPAALVLTAAGGGGSFQGQSIRRFAMGKARLQDKTLQRWKLRLAYPQSLWEQGRVHNRCHVEWCASLLQGPSRLCLLCEMCICFCRCRAGSGRVLVLETHTIIVFLLVFPLTPPKKGTFKKKTEPHVVGDGPQPKRLRRRSAQVHSAKGTRRTWVSLSLGSQPSVFDPFSFCWDFHTHQKLVTLSGGSEDSPDIFEGTQFDCFAGG